MIFFRKRDIIHKNITEKEYKEMKFKSEKETVYQSVLMDIERKIIVKEFKIGDKIPSLTELCEEYTIAKPTAQKVLNDLSERDIIVKYVGRGSFIKNDRTIRQKLLSKHKRQLLFYIRKVEQISNVLGMTREELLEFISDNL